MTAHEKAREVANKIRGEVAAKQEGEVQNRKAAETALAQIEENSELAQMYNASAKVGAENLSGAAPYLKIHAAGKSTTNNLADGKMPNDGWFFYAPTQEQFQFVEAHILTISRGFRTLEDKKNDDGTIIKVEKFNQLMGGIITNGGNPRPFIMFMRGKRLSPMWDFGKQIVKYTTRKPIGIPMFALSIILGTHTENNTGNQGYTHIIDFEIEEDENGNPKLVLDTGEFTFLKRMAEDLGETINSLIAAKEIKKNGAEPIEAQEIEPDPEDDYVPPPTSNHVEVEPDEVPY